VLHLCAAVQWLRLQAAEEEREKAEGEQRVAEWYRDFAKLSTSTLWETKTVPLLRFYCE
jgi:hypothetical protein